MAIEFSRRMQSPLRRQSSSSLPGTPENQSPNLVMNDDDSERRERRLSLMIDKQISQSPRSSYNPIAHLNAVQLAEHYSNCMILSTQNKINEKNAFQLQLIDYMAMMLKKKEPQMENFQVASCTLDASTKIYACRVDNIYHDAFRLAAGFLRTKNLNKKDKNILNPIEELIEATTPQSGSCRKSKRNSMIETNLDKLNMKERVTSNKIDPYFRRMAAKSDEGECGGCHLFQSLHFLDDSQDYVLASDVCWWREHQPKVHKPLVSIKIPVQNFDAINSAEICPSFSSFTFVGWKPEIDNVYSRKSEYVSIDQVLQRDAEHAFDMNAIPEVVPMVEDLDLDGDATDDLEEVEKLGCAGKVKKSSWEYTSLRNSLSREPQEYSYFKKAATVGWSGPIHWKVKPILSKNVCERPPLKKKAKERLSLMYEETTEEGDFEKSKKCLCFKNSTIESWSDLSTTLPVDLNIYPSTLLRLFLKSKIVLKTKDTSIIQVEGVNPFNFDNTNDQEDYCPNLAMDGTSSDDSIGFHEMDLSLLPDIQKLTTAESGYDLVPVPHMVPKCHISASYAQQPKRLNMKRLQEVIYKIMTASENTQEGLTANAQEPEVIIGIFKLCDIYGKISEKLPAKEALNLSIQITFVALLHVASAKNLLLQGSNSLSDIIISQGTNEE